MPKLMVLAILATLAACAAGYAFAGDKECKTFCSPRGCITICP